MIVPILIATTEVPEANATLLIVKLPTNDKGDHITSVQNIKVIDRTSPAEWTTGLIDALAAAFSEFSNSWGAPKLARETLVTPIATKLAAHEMALKG